MRVIKRGFTSEIEYSKQEWAKLEKSYKKQGKNILDYYEVLEPPKKEEIRKSDEPNSDTAKSE